jgi:cyclophilin family peptidyl-prolyl cis-trans isomerase
MKKIWTLSAGITIIAVCLYSYSRVSSSIPSKTKGIDSVKKVCISTNYGDIKIKLYNETPQHRDNFIKLAKTAYFDGLLFHRVIKNFMIQGGDPDSRNADSTKVLGNGGPKYTIPAEIISPKYFHKRGALGAARDNNPAKASSGSQFYIVQGKVLSEQELTGYSQKSGKKLSPEQITAYKTVGGTPWLDGDYTVFGEVYEGIEVVDKIADVKTGANDRPKKDVKMISVKVIE